MTSRATRVAVVFVAAAAGAAGYSWWARSTGPDGVATPAAEQGVPGAPEAAPASALVATLPGFQLADREGRMRSLADWSGKSLVVNFWATWCAPCRREIPLLTRISRDRAANGFEVIGIAVDFREKVLAYADEMKIGYPLLIGEQDGLDAASAFGIEAVGFPFTVFSDRQGRVIAAHLGELHADEATLILDAVQAVNDGRMEPDAARTAIRTGLSALQRHIAEKSAG